MWFHISLCPLFCLPDLISLSTVTADLVSWWSMCSLCWVKSRTRPLSCQSTALSVTGDSPYHSSILMNCSDPEHMDSWEFIYGECNRTVHLNASPGDTWFETQTFQRSTSTCTPISLWQWVWHSNSVRTTQKKPINCNESLRMDPTVPQNTVQDSKICLVIPLSFNPERQETNDS